VPILVGLYVTVASTTRTSGLDRVSGRRDCGVRLEEARMTKVVITHDVADVDIWLKGKDERAAAIGAIGGVNVVDHVVSDGRKSIAVTFDTDNVDAVMSTLADPPSEMAEAMARHGVVPPLAAYIEA
jgi:hypothetical protein